MKRPDDIPIAPAARASATSRRITASSSGVGARSSMPTVIRRSVLWPTCMIVLTVVAGNVSRYSANVVSRVSIQGAKPARYSWRSRARPGTTGASENPQWPTTSVVTPWRILLSARGA